MVKAKAGGLLLWFVFLIRDPLKVLVEKCLQACFLLPISNRLYLDGQTRRCLFPEPRGSSVPQRRREPAGEEMRAVRRWAGGCSGQSGEPGRSVWPWGRAGGGAARCLLQ